MLYDHSTAKLLGIKEVIVKNIEENDGLLKIHIEMPVKEQICPVCR